MTGTGAAHDDDKRSPGALTLGWLGVNAVWTAPLPWATVAVCGARTGRWSPQVDVSPLSKLRLDDGEAPPTPVVPVVPVVGMGYQVRQVAIWSTGTIS